MFRLTAGEWKTIRSQFVTASINPSTMRSQIVTASQGKRNIGLTPYAFTEQGVAMLSEDIMGHCRKSGYRKFHQSLLYDFTMEPAVRDEISGEVDIVEY